MKKTEDRNVHTGKTRRYRKHPIGLRLLAGLLGICLLLVSLPIEHYGYLSWAAQGREIAMFLALPEDVRIQQVSIGTKWEELNLPQTLEAVCCFRQEGDSGENRPDTEQPANTEQQDLDINQNEAGTEQPADTEQQDLDINQDEAETEQPADTVQQDMETNQDKTETEQPENTEQPDIETDEERMETVTIEGITWDCTPEFRSDKEGSYLFTPILPHGYTLAEGTTLPEITVLAMQYGEKASRQEELLDEAILDKKKLDEAGILQIEEPPVFASPSEPGCGIVSEDTSWETYGTLSGGELIVNPGITLTINGVLTISGSVTIKGGGTIVRGSRTAGFKVPSGAELTLENITLDGALVPASCSMIEVSAGGKLAVNTGSRIKQCKTTASGGAIYNNYGTVVLNGAVIEGCTASQYGGGIYNTSRGQVTIEYAVIQNCSASSGGGAICDISGLPKVVIKDGIFNNNRAGSGGALYVCGADLDVYDGEFSENTASSRGGAIYQCGCTGMMDIKGGHFVGNTCSNAIYKGSGAIFNSTTAGTGSAMTLSGSIHFEGDGIEASGTDGVYLDLSSANYARMALISETLTYPVTFYLKAQEGRTIAKGSGGYAFLHERDMKKIQFVDVDNSGVPWYAVLNENKTEVKLSQTPPPYLNKYYIYYISNGATGTVTDDAKGGIGYDMGEKVPVLSADTLQREGYNFKEWNTQADGSGTPYKPGDMLEIQGDTDLYAIFVKGKTLTADFYSGDPRQKKEESVELGISEQSGEVTAPYLTDMEGWTPLGWNADPAGYTEDIIAPEEKITLTEDKEFYGVYEKDVVLSYQAENADIIPENSVGKMYANVHDEISTTMVKFTVAPAAVRYGYAFAGWSTKEDGTDEMYKEGAVLETKTDVTLYAVFKRPLHACYYSGSAGEMEVETVEIPEDATSGTTRTPNLKELRLPENGEEAKATEAGNWSPVGWDLQEDGYKGEIEAGQEVILTDDTNYYGIYEKKVTVSYEGEGVDSSKEVKVCRANVHDTITYEKPIFILKSAPAREGYIFLGWGTEADISAQGSELLYPAGSRFLLDEDTTFYAFWKKDIGHYRVEYHMQELEGDGYVLAETETEEISAAVGTVVEAQPKEYPGFTENTEHPLRYASGKVEPDGGLVLKFFYDRNVYHVDFDLNGGFGSVPEAQSVRYGGLLQTVDAPVRVGYNFKGWYLDKAGSKGKQWNFAWNVEDNTEALNVTLYAKWADETAPVLGKASYEKGYKDFLHWILRKDRLKITVPITEEGSGVKQATYMLIPEQTAEGKETVGAVNIYTPVYGAIGLPLGAVNSRGTINQTKRGRAKIVTRNGETMAEFVISEDFKGTVVMTAGDWAGNVSAEKLLTSEGGGVIVEDNAPDIRFISDKKGQYDNVFEIGVEIRDDADGNVTGGIAEVSYQIDDGKEVSLPQKAFREGIVESYWFTMKITGYGRHRLRVNAVDNAGNSSSRQINVDIRGQNTQNTQSLPPGPEPKTGDTSHVEIFATISMIAGFSYLLLYFREHGMTEDKKEELVSRLVEWAKGKGGIQRMVALALIFLLLAYYHSIGKNVDDEWREVCT